MSGGERAVITGVITSLVWFFILMITVAALSDWHTVKDRAMAECTAHATYEHCLVMWNGKP